MYVRAVGVSCLLSLLLVACGGSGSDSSSQAKLNQIAGVWGDSNADDVEYLVIDPAGKLRIYDYQADAVGTGENCYRIESLDPDLASVVVTANGSFYDLTFRDSEFQGIIENSISLSADGQSFSMWLELDENSARLGSSPDTIIITADRSFSPIIVQRVQGLAQTCLLYTSPSPRDS